MDMDPTVYRNTDGLTYNSGFIYIAAGNPGENFYEIVGVLAHEITHYAMILAYNNSAKPFKNNNDEKKKQFEKIAEEIKQTYETNKNIHTIISSIFDCYPQSAWIAELIVRVPQLLAQYKNEPETLQDIRKGYGASLFMFYEDLFEDLKANYSVLRPKHLIKEINDLCETRDELKNFELELNMSKLKGHFSLLEGSKSIKTLTTNFPKLAMKMIFQFFKQKKSLNLFLRLKSLENYQIKKKIRKLFRFDLELNLIVDCSQSSDIDDNLTIASEFYSIFIIKSSENCTLTENLTFTWYDLDEVFQEKLFENQKIKFQGYSVKLNNLLSKGSLVFAYFPLKNLAENNYIYCCTGNWLPRPE